DEAEDDGGDHDLSAAARQVAPVSPAAQDVAERNEPVDDQEDAADDRREIEPPEVHDEGRREGLTVQVGDLPAEPGHQDTEGDDEQTLTDQHRGAKRRRELVDDQVYREVDSPPHAQGGTDEREPGQRPLADLLDPEETDARQVERGRDPGHHVAQEDADEHIDDQKNHEQRDHDVR